ncbi:MAG: putative GIY-YIG superfamily endonuclease [Salibacteraceae bacterium]|jgi:predicted GIY-YIG superfamily endonuclease
MSKLYIYALATEIFPDEQAYFDASPETEYYYVGRTENPERRKSQHEGEARRGSSYPYHEKIRSLKDGWDLEVLEVVDKKLASDHEEYHMIRLTCEGHPLLNIKRGDRIKRESIDILDSFKRNGIENSTDYSNAMSVAREDKIKLREFRQIKKRIKHVKYDDDTETHYYDLDGVAHTTGKYVSKNELVESLCPSVQKELQELLKRVESLLKEFNAN